MQVQCSAATADLLLPQAFFHLTSRGVIDVKGKGPMETYWISAPVADCEVDLVDEVK